VNLKEYIFGTGRTSPRLFQNIRHQWHWFPATKTVSSIHHESV